MVETEQIAREELRRAELESGDFLRSGQEDLRKNELEESQFIYQQQNIISGATSGKVSGPSALAYFLWALAALVVDILDFVEVAFGYAGGGSALIAIIVAFIFIIFSWIASGHIKKIQDRTEIIQSHTQHLNQRSAHFRQWKRGLKKTVVGRAARKGTAKLLRLVRKSPLGRSVLRNILQVVPVIDLLPWQLYDVYTIHRDHKQAYKDYIDGLASNKIAQQEEAVEFEQSQAEASSDIDEEATNITANV